MAVVGRGTPAKLVHDNQGALRRPSEDGARLGELDEEGRFAAEDAVRCAAAGVDRVAWGEAHSRCWDTASQLGKENQEARFSSGKGEGEGEQGGLITTGGIDVA